MSLSTPSLTTSPEISADAEVASARVAAMAMIAVFMCAPFPTRGEVALKLGTHGSSPWAEAHGTSPATGHLKIPVAGLVPAIHVFRDHSLLTPRDTGAACRGSAPDLRCGSCR